VNPVADALGAALASLRRPSMLALLFLPPLIAFVLWVVAGAWGWHQLVAYAHRSLDTPWLESLLGSSTVEWISGAIVIVLLAPLFFSLALSTTLLITSLVALPIILSDVSKHEYADLEKARGGTWFGSVAAALGATILYLLVWIVALPLLLIVPFGGWLVPLLLHGFFNAWLFRYDVLALHASAQEYRTLRQRHNGGFYRLGIVLAVLQWIPLLNLVTPSYTALAFVHFALARLRELRAETARGMAPATR
jgi:uncharacterized protein involved in cysteine biosynthesis